MKKIILLMLILLLLGSRGYCQEQSTTIVSSREKGEIQARKDIENRSMKILYYGKPWTAGKPLVDDESGLPIEIVTGCSITPEFSAETDAYNRIMRETAKAKKVEAQPLRPGTKSDKQMNEVADREPFSSIDEKEGVVRVRFPSQGGRWIVRVNASEKSRISQYGEIIELKVGDKIELIEKHTSIIAEPVLRDNQYFLKLVSTFDARAFGGKVTSETKYVPVNKPSQSVIPQQPLRIEKDKGTIRTCKFTMGENECGACYCLEAPKRNGCSILNFSTVGDLAAFVDKTVSYEGVAAEYSQEKPTRMCPWSFQLLKIQKTK